MSDQWNIKSVGIQQYVPGTYNFRFLWKPDEIFSAIPNHSEGLNCSIILSVLNFLKRFFMEMPITAIEEFKLETCGSFHIVPYRIRTSIVSPLVLIPSPLQWSFFQFTATFDNSYCLFTLCWCLSPSPKQDNIAGGVF